MPELPEVETSRRGIEPYLLGQTIEYSVVRKSKLRWPVADEIVRLERERVLSVQRRAKYLLIELEIGWIIIHLGMSGSVRVLPSNTPPQKHDHVDLFLSNGKVLRYTDPRRFGAWLWSASLQDCSVLQRLGPEPLSSDFSAESLFTLSRNKKILIKPWIMNNSVVVGVGNIYASESLFTANISPLRAAGSLSEKEIQSLVIAIKQVLQQAIEQGGTTLRDFLQSDGKPGYFAQKLQVYGRCGESCYCCGALITSRKIAQRNTFYCPVCQC